MSKKNVWLSVLCFISLIMLIGVIPLFILWCVFAQYDDGNVFLFIWLPLLIVGLPLFLLSIRSTISSIKILLNDKKDWIVIKARNGKVLINENLKTFKYKKTLFSLDEIVEFQLVNNQSVLQTSGIGESIVGGMLFGGSGAIAGAMVGKKQKIKDDYKIFIKTKNVRNAGIVISLKIDNAYKLFETLNLLSSTNK